jgi:hypothetical protein
LKLSALLHICIRPRKAGLRPWRIFRAR